MLICSVKKMLELQGFRCAGCGIKISKIYSRRMRYCDYYGKLFCPRCHQGSRTRTPARLIYQWNFRYIYNFRSCFILMSFRNCFESGGVPFRHFRRPSFFIGNTQWVILLIVFCWTTITSQLSMHLHLMCPYMKDHESLKMCGRWGSNLFTFGHSYVCAISLKRQSQSTASKSV